MRFLFSITFFAFSLPAFAQPHLLDRLEKLYQKPDLKFGRLSTASDHPGAPIASMTLNHQWASDFENSAGDFSTTDLSIWLPFPQVKLAKDLRIISLLGYRPTWLDTRIPGLQGRETLHRLRLPTLLIYEPADHWLVGGMVMPNFAGDLSSSENFSLSAAFGVGHEFSKEFTLFGGVYYFNGFDESILIPGIAFKWQPSPKWEATLYGPNAALSYSVSPDWALSLTAEIDSPDWHLAADTAGPDRNLSYRSIQVGLKSEHRILKNGWLALSAGYAFAKEFEIRDLADQTLFKQDVDSGPFVQLGLTARF